MTSQFELVIIGFGISGIAMATEAKKKGINYIVLEGSSNSGGVWNTAFSCSRLQTHWKNYKFREFNKKCKSNFPHSGEILEYINEYTKQSSFNVNYNTKVTSCNYIPGTTGKWKTKYIGMNGKPETIYSKYISVCSGYYNVPKEIPGLSNYSGDLINYNKYSKIGLKNKKILIVGNGASCVDLLRHWKNLELLENLEKLDISYKTDKYFLNTYFARFISLFVNKYFLEFLRSIPYWLLIIIIISFCKLNGHVPDVKFRADNVVASGIITDLEKTDKIRYIKSPIACALGKHVAFSNGVVGEYDIIINKCGYKKNIDFMNICDIDKELGYNFSIIDKYPQCAFIGFAPSANWTRVAEAQADWWSNVIIKKNEMPDKLEIQKFNEKYKKTKGDTRVFNDLTYESLEFSDYLLNK